MPRSPGSVLASHGNSSVLSSRISRFSVPRPQDPSNQAAIHIHDRLRDWIKDNLTVKLFNWVLFGGVILMGIFAILGYCDGGLG